MKIFSSILAGAVLLGMSLTAGAATFATPKNYSIIIVDGAKTSSLISDTREIELAPGQHQIVVFFKGLFKHGGDQIIATASDPIVINIPDIQENDSITFTYPRIRDYNSAQDFADHQTITITNNGESVSKDKASYFILQSDKGFQLDRDFLTELNSLGLLYVSPENAVKQNRNDQKLSSCRDSGFKDCPDTIKSTAEARNTYLQNSEGKNLQSPEGIPMTPEAGLPQKPKTDTQNQPAVNAVQVNQQMLDGLKSIYNSADPATRKAFREWLNKN
ncbi:MAG: DUF2057 family protein [Succinimonas sp.]|nr:DUF2057 family protein [Succinimonas sp.]